MYDDDVVHELHRVVKKRAVQMMDRTVLREDPISAVVFSQDFKTACEACGIREEAAIWLSKQYFSEPAEAAVKSRMTLQSSVNTDHTGALRR